MEGQWASRVRVVRYLSRRAAASMPRSAGCRRRWTLTLYRTQRNVDCCHCRLSLCQVPVICLSAQGIDEVVSIRADAEAVQRLPGLVGHPEGKLPRRWAPLKPVSLA